MKNHYETLGVSEEATQAEIKSAFRRKAKQNHPDKNKGKDTNKEMQEITAAYRVLSNPSTRARYDETGEEGEDVLGRAEQVVMQMFSELIDRQLEGAKFNFMASCREIVSNNKTKCLSMKAAENAKLEKLGALSGRVQTESEDNMFSMILSRKQEECERNIKKLSADSELFEQIEKLLELYRDGYIETPEQDLASRYRQMAQQRNGAFVWTTNSA